MTPISGASSGSIKVLWTPYYAGNHTMQIEVSNPNGDDDNSDNLRNRHLTVAVHYDNCVDLTTWTKSGEWKTDSEVYISQNSACHVGNGASSYHSNNMVSTLTTPVFDMAAFHKRTEWCSASYALFSNMIVLTGLLRFCKLSQLQHGCLLGTVEKLGMNIPLSPFYILPSHNQTEIIQ